jgi:ACS family D-galactonate transporter-like MFS transporter
VLQGFVGSFAALFGLRLAVGTAEALAFPANNKLATVWFPQKERGVAGSMGSMGVYVGTALLTPLLFLIAERSFGAAFFFLSGGLGLIWAAVWFLAYCEPHESRIVNAAELDYSEQGGAVTGGSSRGEAFRWDCFCQLLKFRQIWGVCIGTLAATSTLYFFLTRFPTYLAGLLRSVPAKYPVDSSPKDPTCCRHAMPPAADPKEYPDSRPAAGNAGSPGCRPTSSCYRSWKDTGRHAP